VVNSAIKQIALVVGSTLIAIAGVHAQTPCPDVSSDTTVSSSCDTGISLTGANLTIGTPTGGLVEVSNPGETVIIASGMGNSIDNTVNGGINAGKERYGIYNQGTIATLNNSGTISAGIGGNGIYNYGGIISTLTNSGTISAGDGGNGIYNYLGIIGSLTNSGTISAGDGGNGIYNYGGIVGSMTNSGTISAGDFARGVNNYETITSLTNAGTISTGDGGEGIFNSRIIATLTNSGTISAGFKGAGIVNKGEITTLNNSNMISAGVNGEGIFNGGEITTLNNSGTISAGFKGAGIVNYGEITTLNNSNTISAVLEGTGIVNYGEITTLNNLGSILAGPGEAGIDNPGSIVTLNNSGTISGGEIGIKLLGIADVSTGNITTLNNSGAAIISGTSNGLSEAIGIRVENSTIGTINNSGSAIISGISEGLSAAVGIDIFPNSIVGTINNGSSANIFGINTGQGDAYGIYNEESTIGTLNNYGTISATANGSGAAYGVFNVNGAIFTTLNNIGLIKATAVGGTSIGVYNDPDNTITTLNNSGTIYAGAGGTGVSNQGIINTLNNAQGAGNSAGALTYVGNLPTTYNIIIRNPNNFGQLDATNTSGRITFGIYDASIVLNGTYAGVLSGFLLSHLSSISGTFYSRAWSLINSSGSAWDLNISGFTGYLTTNSTFTLTAGSTYQQDIAGTVQASNTSPVGSSGYYSFLNVTNGQFVIQPGSTLAPQLSNLFTNGQAGFGSAIYVPVLGDRLRIVTAAGGISGRFSTVTQPAELAAGTQFIPFYNMAGSNSLDLAVIPTSYQTTIASASGNANAQSVGGALTQLAQASLAGTATVAQDQLLYAISGQTSAQSMANLAQGMSGEVYAATVAVMAQTTQRTQQAVLNRLGDTAGLGLNMPMASPNASTQVGGAPSAAVSSNPNVNPTAEAKSYANGNVWGELAYQRGNRAGDSQSGGWGSNLYQLTFGSDFYASNGTVAGAGLALSSTTLNPTYGASTIQQGSLFAYGKMPVESFVLDAMASVGLSSSDIKRADVTGLSAGFRNKSVSGNDVMVSLGLSRPFETESVRLTPFARVTWQMVSQSGVNEGDVASALSVNSYTGNGVRGVIGLAAGSKANNPMTAKNTYRAYVGVGADSSGLLNPTLNASLVGINTNITTPNAGTAFVQAGLYGTAKMSENTFAYAGISGEARSGQTLGTVNVGLKVQF
jgi:hypothetical protein